MNKTADSVVLAITPTNPGGLTPKRDTLGLLGGITTPGKPGETIT